MSDLQYEPNSGRVALLCILTPFAGLFVILFFVPSYKFFLTSYEFFLSWQADTHAAETYSTLIKVCASAGAMSAAMFAASWAAGKEHAYGISHTTLLRRITIFVRVILLLIPIVMAVCLPPHLIEVYDASNKVKAAAPAPLFFPPIFFTLLLIDVCAIVTAAFYPLFLTARFLSARAEKRMVRALRKDLANGTDFWQGYMDSALAHALGGGTRTMMYCIRQIWRWVREVESVLLKGKEAGICSKDKVKEETVLRQLRWVLVWCSRLLSSKSRTPLERRRILSMFIDASCGVDGEKQVRFSLVAFLLFHPIIPAADTSARVMPKATRTMEFIIDAIRESEMNKEEKDILLWEAARWHLSHFWTTPDKDVVQVMKELIQEKVDAGQEGKINSRYRWLVPAYNVLAGSWEGAKAAGSLRAHTQDATLQSECIALSSWV